jgi:hypothetical protein
MHFRLVRQPEIAYITEEGKPYGDASPPRMSWDAPRGHLFVGGWQPIDMGLGHEAIARAIREHLVRI